MQPIYFSDTVDFLKAISPRTLPGVQELQRRDLLHRASDLAFEDHISDEDDDEEHNLGKKTIQNPDLRNLDVRNIDFRDNSNCKILSTKLIV